MGETTPHPADRLFDERREQLNEALSDEPVATGGHFGSAGGYIVFQGLRDPETGESQSELARQKFFPETWNNPPTEEELS